MANILVADDEACLRRVLVHALEMHGHQVSEAQDGVEALNLYSVTKHDLVITDLIMPEMEGLEAIAELIRRNPAQRIIAITAGGRGSFLGYLKLAKSFGAKAVLAKPFTLEELKTVVTQVLAT